MGCGLNLEFQMVRNYNIGKPTVTSVTSVTEKEPLK